MGTQASSSGMRVAVRRHDITAHDVANVNTGGYEERTAHQAETLPAGARITHITRTPNPDPSRSNTDLAKETGEQIVNRHSFSANVKAARTKDDMLGEVIDLPG